MEQCVQRRAVEALRIDHLVDEGLYVGTLDIAPGVAGCGEDEREAE